MTKDDPVRRWIAMALDLLALLLVAAGVAAAAYLLIGWACLAVAGVVVYGGSLLGDRAARRPVPPKVETL